MNARSWAAVVVAVFVAQGCTALVPSPTPSPSPRPSESVPCLRAEYVALPTNSQPVTIEGLGTMRTIIENRLRDYGLASVEVQTQGADRIVVQFPVVANVQDVRDLIVARGQLDFVEVPPDRASEVVSNEPVPAGLKVIFSGDQIDTAGPGFTATGQPAVDVTFRAEGAQIFDDYAAAHVGERFAIVLDGNVVAAPTINAARFGGKAQVSGAFNDETEVARLVTLLRYGALPYRAHEIRFGPCAT